jgi:hypothetical protein
MVRVAEAAQKLEESSHKQVESDKDRGSIGAHRSAQFLAFSTVLRMCGSPGKAGNAGEVHVFKNTFDPVLGHAINQAIPNMTLIDQRPIEVAMRLIPGHFVVFPLPVQSGPGAALLFL